MMALELLSRPRRVHFRLEKAEQRVAALQSLTERVTVKYGLDSEPVSHSRNTTLMQDAIARLMEAKEAAARMREELAAAELEVGMVLVKIQDETLREFMFKRYLDLRSVQEAAEEMDYSYSWGRWEAERGVQEVQQILDEMEASGEISILSDGCTQFVGPLRMDCAPDGDNM